MADWNRARSSTAGVASRFGRGRCPPGPSRQAGVRQATVPSAAYKPGPCASGVGFGQAGAASGHGDFSVTKLLGFSGIGRCAPRFPPRRAGETYPVLLTQRRSPGASQQSVLILVRDTGQRWPTSIASGNAVDHQDASQQRRQTQRWRKIALWARRRVGSIRKAMSHRQAIPPPLVDITAPFVAIPDCRRVSQCG